jgi:hypothetical protein
MFDPDKIPDLQRLIREQTRQDAFLLVDVLKEVGLLRPAVRTIQARSTNTVSLVASDGGNNRIDFNPFSIQVIRVVDSYGVELFLDAITPYTDTGPLGERHLGEARSPLGQLMRDLGVTALSALSPMIPRSGVPSGDGRRSTGWPLVYRDLCEWAVLYQLICHKEWGSSTLIVRDGMLRSKIFAAELFVKMGHLLRKGIEETRKSRRRDVFLVGIAKHSEILQRYQLAMQVQNVLPAGQPCYAAIPMDLQERAYRWPEYIRSPLDEESSKEPPKYNIGAMYLARFGGKSADPVWTIDLMHWQTERAQEIFGYLLGDACDGFPVPYYPRCLQDADRNAQVVDLDLAILRDAMEDAVRGQIEEDRRPVFDAHRLATADPAARRYS